MVQLLDGSSLPVVGQATGHALDLRIGVGPGRALVAVGVGEQPVTQCLGAFDGPATGPQVGDLGEWHATAGVQNLPGAARGGRHRDRGARQPPGWWQPPGWRLERGRHGRRLEWGSSGGGSGPVCLSGQTRCGDACVDLRTDPFNCGACGNRCAVNNCTGGVCREAGAPVQDCAPPFAVCAAACVNLTTDPAHCGTCDTACATGETCVNSVCTPGTTGASGCPEGQVLCGTACQEALPNFGTDGLSCPGGGAPPTACPAGRILCNGACFPEGACQPADCPPGQGYCYGVCRDFQNDPGYCGGCGTACPGGICSGGACVTCEEGTTPCGAACVDTKTDLNNCGFCGNLCGTQCIDGQCTGVGPAPALRCLWGETICGDECVNISEDRANCGGCGIVCPADSICGPMGVCHPCAPGLTVCGDTCVDITSDLNNCGACGYVCPDDANYCGDGGDGIVCAYPPISGPQALAPTDVASCPPGQVDCGGICVDLSSDPFNCGSCGVICAAGTSCQSGACA